MQITERRLARFISELDSLAMDPQWATVDAQVDRLGGPLFNASNVRQFDFNSPYITADIVAAVRVNGLTLIVSRVIVDRWWKAAASG